MRDFERVMKLKELSMPPDLTEAERKALRVPERMAYNRRRVNVEIAAVNAVEEGACRGIGHCALCFISEEGEVRPTCDEVNAIVGPATGMASDSSMAESTR